MGDTFDVFGNFTENNSPLEHFLRAQSISTAFHALN